MTISVHVRPPTVACVALSNAARSGSLLPYRSPKSPRIEQAPIAHVRIARSQSSRTQHHIARVFSPATRRRRSRSIVKSWLARKNSRNARISKQKRHR
ncbi:hypothetical protein X777_11644 [Ooceraea biroi]|uniref:Uncharacterized protein n=1 Tax=Ooceraea biroi TaxID=2015173 RepID=A0A026W132_OOCBI|nr:hypothetical protein X777_11644 [Ooceraea biroi]